MAPLRNHYRKDCRGNSDHQEYSRALVKRLKQHAAAHRRSLNLEVITDLEQMTHSVPSDAETLLARARAVRRTPKGVKLTDGLLHDLRVGF